MKIKYRLKLKINSCSIVTGEFELKIKRINIALKIPKIKKKLNQTDLMCDLGKWYCELYSK